MGKFWPIWWCPKGKFWPIWCPLTRYTEKVIDFRRQEPKGSRALRAVFQRKIRGWWFNLLRSNRSQGRHHGLTTRPKPSPEPLDAPAEVVTLPIKSPPKPFDPDKDMWDRAVAVLGGGKGCRGIIGRAVKEHGRVSVLQAVETCEEEHPADPVAFFRGRLRFRAKSTAVAKPDPNTPPRSARDVLERDVFRVEVFRTHAEHQDRELPARARCRRPASCTCAAARTMVCWPTTWGRSCGTSRTSTRGTACRRCWSSPHQLAWLYLDYLRERGMGGNTLAMFKPDSPIFAQFCGERWQLDAYGRDPLTGRSHY